MQCIFLHGMYITDTYNYQFHILLGVFDTTTSKYISTILMRNSCFFVGFFYKRNKQKEIHQFNFLSQNLSM